MADAKEARIYTRLVAAAISEALGDTPVVCLLGPRQSGKSTLVRRLLPGRHYVTFDDPGLLDAARADPLGFLRALPEQVTLDEIQRVPELLPPIKLLVDENRTPGRFVLTGSANLLLLPSVNESLAGRMEVVRLHPLSEMEKQGAETSFLETLVSGALEAAVTESGQVVDGTAEAICSGGYPEPLGRPARSARRWYRQYLRAVIQRNVRAVAQIRKEDDLLRLVEYLAHQTANLLNVNAASNDLGLDRETINRYIAILERLFLVRQLPAWHRNGTKRLVSMPKVHIVDSGLAANLLRLTPADWSLHSTEFGGLLESFVVQQLICQSGWVDSELRFSHYRDKDQKEVDLVIEQGRRVWGVEVKRSASIKRTDAKGLARLAAQAGKHFQGGALLYSGTNTLPLEPPNCFAVPIDRLWHE